MKRFISLLKKDIILGFKDIFILLELAFAVFFVLVMIFIIPEDIKKEAAVFIYDETGIIENFVRQYSPNPEEEMGELYLDSRQAVIDGMVENRSAVGLIIKPGDNKQTSIELLNQPYTKPALVHYIKTELEDLFAILSEPGGVYPPEIYERVRIEALKEGRRDEIPFNKILLPVILFEMVGIIGLFAMISLIGQERNDQTMRAYRLTPAGLSLFILSKEIMVMLTGICTFSILFIPLMGLSAYLPSLLLMILTITAGSSGGIILGSFYDSPLKAMGWVFILLVILAFPAISLFAPVFNPGWLRFIPSYPIMFGLDAAMFPDGNESVYRNALLYLSVFDLVIVPVSIFIFRDRIRREA